MSFDPFEARMQFLQLLRKLNASQQSIHKVVGYAIKYGSKCGEDLWECILEECGKGSLNTRINLLYLLDSLLEVSLPLPLSDAPYPPLISTNLGEIVKRVVPEKEGVLNLRAAKQILESWRTRRLIEPEIIGDALKILDGQNHRGESSTGKRGREAFSKSDIVRRMEEDRERHKRLRERIWILPIPPLIPTSKPRPPIPAAAPSPSTTTTTASQSPYTPQSPAPNPATRLKNGIKPKSNMGPPPPPSTTTTEKNKEDEVALVVDPLDVEFDQLWEGGSDLDPDDLERMKEDSIILADLEKEKS